MKAPGGAESAAAVTFPSGLRLGPYEIVAPLASSGTGEVYRARDTRLGRDVAVKVLPEAWAADPGRLRRFQEEARAAGALGHPGVVAVFDTGTHGGRPYIVRELLEGATLRAELGAPMPPRHALELAVQIALGLAAAHGKGIVHGRLEPEALLSTRDRRVKIADFGLGALLSSGEPAARSGTREVTRTVSPATGPGALPGGGYVSPEQARGLAPDHRSDIFSFGAVLYEMLTGRRAFRGESAVETLHAVLHDPPPEAPQEADHAPLFLVVRRCLEKDPAARFQSARDLAFALEALGRASTGVTRPAVPLPRSGRRLRIAAPAAGLALLAAALLLRPAPLAPRAVAFDVLPPDGGALRFWDRQPSMELSPDGRRLAFSARAGRAPSRLYVRALDEVVPRPLAGTEGGAAPFWSPDGTQLGFFAGGKLKRVPAAGGPVQVLCDASTVDTATWGAGGAIVMSYAYGLARVPAAGGPPQKLDLDLPEHTSLLWPSFLPDGRRFLFLSLLVADGSLTSDVYVATLGSAQPGPTRLVRDGSRALYAERLAGVTGAPRLLFVRGGTLSAQPFDARTLEVSGSPEPLVEHVRYHRPSGNADISVARDGSWAYQPASHPVSGLAIHGRDGVRLSTIGRPADFQRLRLSPDGSRLALEIVDPEAGSKDIWIYELDREAPLRFTTSPLSEAEPVFAPDGSRLVFTAGVPPRLFERDLGGGAARPLPVTLPGRQLPNDVSPDGKALVFQSSGTNGTDDLWTLRLDGPSAKPEPFVATPAYEGQACFSPDGAWVAYVSDVAGGVPDVYVRPFAGAGAAQRVSTTGGFAPRWRRDGKELYFATARALHAASVEDGPAGRRIGEPRLLFGIPGELRAYDAAADGQRFVLNVATGAPPRTALRVTVSP